ncbi:HAD hydrolase-like protein [Luteolibacter pohnpeiensis]|uniref:HAD hydrolase-like protein n=1 Tax=Luteolibacter pohnpeiensis TaxID=454153 RepID=A0A934S7X8_9BACT|nr:HAD family hydrolase [Luteolibacter pohnpeiensis]MBK1881004.1 HAD hydrolase-like protein [Luteolibacter pohnpeiensis]
MATTQRMHVAIVHYHLQAGGVSSVIRAHSELLTATGIPHVILVGEAPDNPTSLPIRVIKGLGYEHQHSKFPSAPELLQSVMECARDALGATPDLWHFHNHSLGKSRLVPEMVALLAEKQARLLLQIHDLAEDGRPENYHHIRDLAQLYPIAPNIRYAWINRSDQRQFLQLGIPEIHTDYLPNPVSIPATESDVSSTTPPLLLAPIRGIRRKNLGELVLLSKFLPAGARIAITQAPKNPTACPVHDDWRAFAARLKLPIDFAVVDESPGHRDASNNEPRDFDFWLKRATHFITTSVVEGFGLPFFESLKLRKPILGRNLPKVTADHPSRIGQLYERIPVPCDEIDLTALRRTMVRSLEHSHRLYGQPLKPEFLHQTYNSLLQNRAFDFGNLPESIQRDVILRTTELKVESEGKMVDLREWLSNAVSSQWSNEVWTEPTCELLTSYHKLIHSQTAPPSHLEREQVLRAYFRPEHFHFLMNAEPQDLTASKTIRACVFDIYGTLLIAKPGGIKPDPHVDSALRALFHRHGFSVSASPSSALHALVQNEHHNSPHAHPEIDLLHLLREWLEPGPNNDMHALLVELEDCWHPCSMMPGVISMLTELAGMGMVMGLLSNAQANTLTVLDRFTNGASRCIDSDLSILSYQHRIAKPSAGLFQLMADRLATRGIAADETLFIGNDPAQDIAPAARIGFRTALFTGHPDSIRPGNCKPDYLIEDWTQFADFIRQLNDAASRPIHTSFPTSAVPKAFSAER